MSVPLRKHADLRGRPIKATPSTQPPPTVSALTTATKRAATPGRGPLV